MSEEYMYYWATKDGLHGGGPFQTIGALKSGIQTSRWGGYYDRESRRWRSYAKDGIIITRAQLVKVPDTEWQEEWIKK